MDEYRKCTHKKKLKKCNLTGYIPHAWSFIFYFLYDKECNCLDSNTWPQRMYLNGKNAGPTKHAYLLISQWQISSIYSDSELKRLREVGINNAFKQKKGEDYDKKNNKNKVNYYYLEHNELAIWSSCPANASNEIIHF